MEYLKLASFMSERASPFLSSIGLLGEYCPSRKKDRHSGLEVGCMHLNPHEEFYLHREDCQFIRPASVHLNFIDIEEHHLILF